MKDPRPHQIEAVRLLRASLKSGKRRPVLALSTGAGKTVIAAMIVRMGQAKGTRLMFIVDALSLIDQTVSAFYDEGIYSIGVIQADHPMTNWSAQVQVCSVQTLQRCKTLPPVGLVIVDEMHSKNAWLLEQMATGVFRDVPVIGLSATPWAKGLGLHYDDLLKPISMKELTDLGYLTPLVAYAPSHPDLSKVHVKAGEYQEAELSVVMRGEKLVANVVDTWKALGEDRPTFAFCVDRAHARDLQMRFQNSGVWAGYIDGTTPAIERREVFRQLDAGEMRIVCSVGALIKGVDEKVACIISAAPTKSPMRWVQSVGRGLRVNPPYHDCILLDHSDNALRLGLPIDIDREELDVGRVSGKDVGGEAKAAVLPKPCPKCGKLKTASRCACGFETRRENEVSEGAGTLARIGDGKKGPAKAEITPADKVKFYAELKGYVALKGKKPGFADAMFKTKHGHWPAVKHGIEPREPSPETLSYIRSRQISYAKGMAKQASR